MTTISNIDFNTISQLRDLPLKSKADLDNFFKFFLGVHLASVPLEEGNSCPLDFAWDVYSTAIQDDLTMEDVTNFMAMANRGGQKCARGDTMVSTHRGIKRLDEFMDGDVISSFPRVAEGQGLELNGTREIWRIDTHNGYYFEGTNDHLVSTYNNGIEYKTIENITEDDYVLIGGNNLDTNFAEHNDFDLGYLIGVLIGDGCLTIKDSIQLEIQDLGILNKVKDILNRQYNIHFNLKFNKTNNCWKIRFHNVNFKKWLLSIGLEEVTAPHKRIPKCVWEGNTEMRSGFLSGYFDTDGSLTWGIGRGSHCRFRWGVASEQLMKDLQILLINYKIKSHRSKRQFKASKNSKAPKNKIYTSHNLCVNGVFAYRLLSFISSFSTRKTRIKAFANAHNADPNKLNGDTFPKEKIWGLIEDIRKYYQDNYRFDDRYYVRNKANVGGKYRTITRKKLKRFLEVYGMCDACEAYKTLKLLVNSGFFLEKVKKVHNTGVKDKVYDLTVPDNKNFLGNGMVVHNTLTCGSLITILLMHDRFRDIIHMASIAAQANVLFEVWLNRFAGRPFMQEVFPKLTMRRTVAHTNRMLTITHGTMDAVNAHHGGILIQDEVDLTDPVVFDESKGMLVASRGKVPLNIMISSRKFALGNIQHILDKIDEDPAFGERIHVHRWGQLETTARCTSDRSGPGGIPIMVDEENLVAVSTNEWENLPKVEQGRYQEFMGYSHCLKCGIFSFCQGKLKRQAENEHLTPIEVTADNFRRESREFFISQRLNRKPSTKGIVYALYSPHRHDKTVGEIAVLLTDDKSKNSIMSVGKLIELIKDLGYPIYMGVDFGYNEAVAELITVDKLGRIFVIDELSASEVSDRELALLTHNRWGQYAINYIFPDIASPGGIKEFIKIWGENCGVCTTTNKDVEYGINLVRNRLFKPGTTEPMLFINKLACKALRYGFKNYQYKLDPKLNEPIDTIWKRFDHAVDALRYVIATIMGMTPFSVSWGESTVGAHDGNVMLLGGQPTLIHAPSGEELLKYAGRTPTGPSAQDKTEEETKPGAFWFSVDG